MRCFSRILHLISIALGLILLPFAALGGDMQNPELDSLAHCLSGPLSQPHDLDHIFPKPRGQSLFIDSAVFGYVGVHTYHIFVVPRVLPPDIPGTALKLQIDFIYEDENQQITARRAMINQNQLLNVERKSNVNLKFEGLNGQCQIGSRAVGLALDCGSKPLTLNIRMVPFEKDPNGYQPRIVPTLEPKDFKEAASVQLTGDVISREEALTELLKDLAKHLREIDERLTDKGVPASIPLDTVKKCQSVVDAIDKKGIMFGAPLERALDEFKNALETTRRTHSFGGSLAHPVSISK